MIPETKTVYIPHSPFVFTGSCGHELQVNIEEEHVYFRCLPCRHPNWVGITKKEFMVMKKQVVEKELMETSGIEEFFDLFHDKSCLDGWFTSKQLRAIAHAMDRIK